MAISTEELAAKIAFKLQNDPAELGRLLCQINAERREQRERMRKGRAQTQILERQTSMTSAFSNIGLSPGNSAKR